MKLIGQKFPKTDRKLSATLDVLRILIFWRNSKEVFPSSMSPHVHTGEPEGHQSDPPERVHVDYHEEVVQFHASVDQPTVASHRKYTIAQRRIWPKILVQIHRREVDTDTARKCHVRAHYDEVPLVVVTDANSRQITVVVTFEYACMAHDAVVRSWRAHTLARVAPPPVQQF